MFMTDASHADMTSTSTTVSSTNNSSLKEKKRALANMREFEWLFNHGSYYAASELAGGRCRDLENSKDKDRHDVKPACSTLATMAQIMLSWDRFDYKDATTKLDRFLNLVENLSHVVTSDNLSSIKKYYQTESLNKYLNQLKDDYKCLSSDHATSKPDEFPSYFYVQELISNAYRKIDRGEYEDAILRLYRAVEMVAQITLWRKYGLNVIQKVQLDRLPKEIQEELRPSATDNRVAIARTYAYEILKYYNDPLFKRYHEAGFGTPQSELNDRNQSILTHGVSVRNEKGKIENLLEKSRKVTQVNLVKFPQFDPKHDTDRGFKNLSFTVNNKNFILNEPSLQELTVAHIIRRQDDWITELREVYQDDKIRKSRLEILSKLGAWTIVFKWEKHIQELRGERQRSFDDLLSDWFPNPDGSEKTIKQNDHGQSRESGRSQNPPAIWAQYEKALDAHHLKYGNTEQNTDTKEQHRRTKLCNDNLEANREKFYKYKNELQCRIGVHFLPKDGDISDPNTKSTNDLKRDSSVMMGLFLGGPFLAVLGLFLGKMAVNQNRWRHTTLWFLAVVLGAFALLDVFGVIGGTGFQTLSLKNTAFVAIVFAFAFLLLHAYMVLGHFKKQLIAQEERLLETISPEFEQIYVGDEENFKSDFDQIVREQFLEAIRKINDMPSETLTETKNQIRKGRRIRTLPLTSN